MYFNSNLWPTSCDSKFNAMHGERKLVCLLSFPKRLGRGRREQKGLEK